MWSNPLSKNAQQSNRRRKKRNELKNELIYRSRTRKRVQKERETTNWETKNIKRTEENEKKKLKYETSEDVTRKHRENMAFNGKKMLTTCKSRMLLFIS